jgi:hypothetical protein
METRGLCRSEQSAGMKLFTVVDGKLAFYVYIAFNLESGSVVLN